MSHNATIIKNLKVLRDQEKVNKQPFKVRAYNIAIRSIESFGGEIKKAEDVKGLDGVGAKIYQKIEEIIANGHLDRTKDVLEENDERHVALKQLQDVMEIGPAKAKELYETHGIKSIEQLMQNQHLLNDKQRMGLKYYDEFLKRIPRKEMEKHNDFIIQAVHDIDPDMHCVLAGSFRRGRPDSGDIDVLLCHKSGKYDTGSFKRVVALLQEKKYLTDLFANGDKKCMAAGKLPRFKTHRRVDLLYTDQSTFPFALLYFTGSQQFNVKMREHCLKQGYSLNEYGLKYVKGDDKNKKVDKVFLDEAEIFDYVGLEYVTPVDREKGEITPLLGEC